jgi:hypothetical protein
MMRPPKRQKLNPHDPSSSATAKLVIEPPKPKQASTLSAHHRLRAASLTLPSRIDSLKALLCRASRHLNGALTSSDHDYVLQLFKNEVHFQPFRYNTTASLLVLKHFGREDLLEQGIITHVTPPKEGGHPTAVHVSKRVIAKFMAEDNPTLFKDVLDLPLDETAENQNSNINLLTSLWTSIPDVPQKSKSGVVKPGRKRTPACFGQFQWSKSTTTALQLIPIRKMWLQTHEVSTTLISHFETKGEAMTVGTATKLLTTIPNIGHLISFIVALDLSVTGLVLSPTKDELVYLHIARISI